MKRKNTEHTKKNTQKRKELMQNKEKMRTFISCKDRTTLKQLRRKRKKLLLKEK